MTIVVVEHALHTDSQRTLLAKVLDDFVIMPIAHDLVLNVERHVLVLPQQIDDLLVDFELLRIDICDLGLASNALFVFITQNLSYTVLTKGMPAVWQYERLAFPFVEEFFAALAGNDEVHFQ